uniref:FERM domain-containing protein n=1 Tax=Caenorhabditis japonica TaxID=281687 RepID=A0A8R1I7D8_CAEJA
MSSLRLSRSVSSAEQASTRIFVMLKKRRCNLSENLCDNDESCHADGVFGQCYSPAAGSPPPTVLDNLDDTQLELLKLELTRLASKDKDWGDEETQCVLAYFKMSVFYQLQYDPDFCQVRKPANVWALIQLIDTGLSEDPTLLDETATASAASPSENVTEEEIAQVIEQLKEPSLPTEEDVEDLPQEFSFEVKFYPTTPTTIVDDHARYYVFLQLRRDILTGRLPATADTHALHGSFVVEMTIKCIKCYFFF